MAVRYRNEFYSTEGTLWKIDIYDSSYTGSVIEFETTSSNFQLIYNGGNQRFEPIIGSELKVFAWVRNALFETFISDIIGAGESRFYAVLYKDSVMFWAGSLIQDNIKKEDAYYPYEFEISFTDGLGTLKDHLFWQTNTRPETLYTGKESLIGIIYKAISKAGAGLNGNTIFWAATDSFISTCVHWYEYSQHNFFADSDPLLYTQVSHEAFYEEKDGVLTAMSCYDVLTNILSTFGARLFMSNGKYIIMQVNEHICTNTIWRNYRVTDGAYLSYSFEANNIDTDEYSILAGRNYTYTPGLLKVSKKYKYKASPYGSNLLPKKNNYETETNLQGTIVGGSGESLKINGTIIETLTGTLTTVWGGTVHTRYKMTVKITSLTGTVKYLSATAVVGSAPNVLQWEYSWSDTPSYIYIYVGIYGVLVNQTIVGHEIAFVTCELPFDCVGTFKFEQAGWVTNSNTTYTPVTLTLEYRCDNFIVQQVYPSTTATSGVLVIGHYYRINNYVVGDNFTNVGAGSNSTGIEFTASGTTPTSWGSGSELLDLSIQTPDGEVEYKATSTLTGKSKILTVEEVLIGDGYNHYSIGSLEVSDGTSWVESESWSLKKDATTKKIHQLFCSEVLCGQLTAVEMTAMTIVSPTCRPDRSVVLSDDTIYAFLSGTLSGHDDVWSGEWFKMQNMAVVEEDQIFLSKGVLSEEYLWTNQSWVDESFNDDEINVPSDSTGGSGQSSYSASSSLKASEGTQTVDKDTEITVPTGNMLTLIAIKNTGVQFTLKIGLTSGGTEIFTDVITENELRSLPLHLILSASGESTVYVSSDDWTDAEISMYVKLEAVF